MGAFVAKLADAEIARARRRIRASSGRCEEGERARPPRKKEAERARTGNRGGRPSQQGHGELEDDPGDRPGGEQAEEVRVLLRGGGARRGEPRVLHRRARLSVVVLLLRPRQGRGEHLRFGGKLPQRVEIPVQTRAGKLRAQHGRASVVALHLQDNLVAGLLQTAKRVAGEIGGRSARFSASIEARERVDVGRGRDVFQISSGRVKRDAGKRGSYPRSSPPRPVNSDATFMARVFDEVEPPLAPF